MNFAGESRLLSALVPNTVLRQLASEAARGPRPHFDSSPAALALIDITGFTSLTTALVKRGPTGTEQLSHVLNSYLGRIIDLVHAHGGDVLKILGDGVLVSWTAGDDDLAQVTRRAAICGLEVANALGDVEVGPGMRLSLKVGICAGDMLAGAVGGLDGRWLFVVAGDGPSQLSSLEPHLQTGGVALSHEAWTLIDQFGVGQRIGQDHVRLLAMHQRLEPRPLVPAVLDISEQQLLRAYIPAVVLSRLDAGQAEWLGEFRLTTVMFANVRRPQRAQMQVEQLNEVTLTLQRVIERFHGWSKEITIDEKGTTFVAAFGVPPFTHEDDAARAVEAAREVQAELGLSGLSAGIGIATGAAFCGPVGNASRRDFAVIGQHVNLAARLAQIGPQDGVLCDEATYEAAQSRFTLERLPSYLLKGMSPVAVFRSRGVPGTSESTFVDRHAEIEALMSSLRKVSTGSGSLLILEGEPGIGKSRLVDELLARASANGVRCLVGAGVAIEHATPYYAWRPVIQDLIGITSATDPAVRRELVRKQLNDLGSVDLSPLLDQFVSVDMRDNELTRQMTGEARAENTRELLMRLLARAAGTGELLIVLEDAHWIDSLSVALVLRVRREIPQALVVLTTRPFGKGLTETIAAASAEATTLAIGPLPGDDALTLAADRMGAVKLQEPVATLMQERTEGNPLFLEQLTYALRDGDHIVIEDGVARFASDAAAPAAIVPGTLQRVITSRIDQLPAAEALTLKVASVIGRDFTLRTLSDVHPLQTDEATLRSQLETLTRLDLVRVDSTTSEASFRFTHALTQQVAYGLMLPGQSRQLHRSIAERFERDHAEDLGSHHAFLAHHWHQAGIADRAVAYLESAAAQALRGFANDEAVRSLRLAISIADEDGLTIEPVRRGSWEIQLGEAYANLSQYKAAGEHLASGLRLMGRPAPQRGRQEIVWLMRELFEQSLRRVGLWSSRSGSDPQRTAAVLRAYWALAEVSYYDGQTVLPLWCTIRMVNAAEAARNPSETARAFGSTGALFGLIPVHRFAEWYLARASTILGSVADLTTHEIVEIMVGFYYVGAGKWRTARERIARAEAIARRLGDRRRLADAMSNVIEMDCLLGNFASASSAADQVYESATRRGDRRWQAEALAAKAYCFTHLGRAGDALKCLAELKTLADASATTPDQNVKLFGALALAHLSRGERQQAIAASDEAVRLTKGQRPAYVGAFYGYAAPAEVRLAHWEADSSARFDRKEIDQCLKPLQTYASVFPVGKPRALNLEGRGWWLKGEVKRALQSWRRALAAAQMLEMPFEEALTHYEIGRHLDSPAERSSHLGQARVIFARLGAIDALGRTEVAAVRSK